MVGENNKLCPHFTLNIPTTCAESLWTTLSRLTGYDGGCYSYGYHDLGTSQSGSMSLDNKQIRHFDSPSHSLTDCSLITDLTRENKILHIS